jgi:tetratricopeptide (TPR) repeat protein
MRQLAAFTALALASWLDASFAFAQTSAAGNNALVAQGLFDAGLRLMDAGQYSEACPKLIESQRLAPAGGTLTNIALCHEKEGKLATALLDYQTALTQATKDQRADRQNFARSRIVDLTAKVPWWLARRISISK